MTFSGFSLIRGTAALRCAKVRFIATNEERSLMAARTAVRLQIVRIVGSLTLKEHATAKVGRKRYERSRQNGTGAFSLALLRVCRNPLFAWSQRPFFVAT